MNSESANRIRITAEEITAATLSADHCNEALHAIAADGFVVLEGAVDISVLPELIKRMDQDTERLIAFQNEHGGNPRARGHLQQGPPICLPFVSRTVTANPFAIGVSKTALGSAAYLRFYNGNTNLPGSEYQAVHVDNAHLWPQYPMASPPFSLVISILPVACTTENGATELWPGTHLLPADYAGNNVAVALQEERRVVRPPVQVETAAGDIVIRDSRLWHRGVPNGSSRPRHMVSAIHSAGWLQRERPLRFQQGCEPVFENQDFDFNVEFVEGDNDYLFGPTRQIYRREGHWRDDKAAAAAQARESAR